jgi:outer membrane protein OmpA-like peptidoglycan-associated protein
LRYKFDENSLGLVTKRVEEAKPVAAIEAAMQVAPVTVPVAIVLPIAPVVLTPATPVIVVQATPAAKYEKITLAAGALFAHNKSAVDQILPEGRTQLNNLAAKLKTLTNLEKITISGHADITNGTGDASYNDSLSLARAAAVKSYMATQGLNVSQVSVSGFGGLKPVKTDCAMPKGAVTTKIGVIRGSASSQDMDNLRACLLPNRRVDVEIFGQAITN